MLQRVVREFALKDVAPIAAEIDVTERYPIENVRKMAEMGLMGIPIPKEFGGSGGDELGYAMTVEELSKHCASTGVILSAHTSLGSWPILKYGTQEQKEKFLKPLATGEKIGAFALTEAGAGTDASAQQTVAVLDGDSYILNGSKIFITGAGQADIYIIFAMTDKSKGTRGISTFIVEKGTPGFTFGKLEDKMGIRASSTGELIFEDCRIPKENLLGKEGKGFGIAMSTLDGGRIGIAAQALGIAQGAIDASVQYMKERKQFGKNISKFQGLQWYVAEMETKTQAARLLVYQAATKKSKGLPYSKEAAMAKLFAAETAMEVTTKAVQLFGGYGYTKDYPVERMMRDAKITEIYEGTSEVQKMVIAASVIGR
jgi:butyryl-CoA dehydrogenase